MKCKTQNCNVTLNIVLNVVKKTCSATARKKYIIDILNILVTETETLPL